MRTSLSLRAGAAAIAAALLVGCAGGDPQSNRACREKWETVLNLARCTFDIQPPAAVPPPAEP